jgi:hypothetical protein
MKKPSDALTAFSVLALLVLLVLGIAFAAGYFVGKLLL